MAWEKKTVDFDWNEEAIAKLKKEWENGISASEIGRRVGVSKNSVVGKAHRLNLPSRPSPIHPADGSIHRPTRKVTRVESKRAVVLVPKEVVVVPMSLPVVRQVISYSPHRTCQWVDGAPSFDARKCGEQTVRGYSYCGKHCDVAYVRRAV